MQPNPMEWFIADFVVLFVICAGGGFAFVALIAAIDEIRLRLKQRRYQLARK